MNLGKENSTISEAIKKYNDFAKLFFNKNNITFLNITDITQQGLANPTLVASDGLHPSKEAYSKFVERLVPIVLEKLGLK
ncbi:SGNH/GDSL hydrolase family protein [Polaribacter sp. SA4-10]|uniref:SGNH/GDSL hydrolase family protein n=1 Tax=Polaribacter sp. SA4-10 TaxID=754397 RepID=UPI0012FAA271